MAGEYVPLVMVPRFTSYVGEAVYTTVALDVDPYARFVATFWRGPLAGDPQSVPAAAFAAVFEASDDAEVWQEIAGTSISGPDARTVVEADLTRRWLRAKVTLTADDTDVVAITCWAAGHLERRGAQ